MCKCIITVILTAGIIATNATPSCRFYDENKNNFVCSPVGTDYELKKGLVSNQDNVKSISLRGCGITDIDCDAFVGLPMLQHLDIAENKLQELKPCTLVSLPQLNSLDLSFNKISVLSPGTFDHLNNIEELYLKGNELRNLQNEIFDKLKKLNVLDLSNNVIDGSNLSPRIFDNNKIITSLDLSRNDMSRAHENLLQSFQTLQSLYLDRCFLTRVPSFVTKSNLKTLQQLILSTNQITNLDDPTSFINMDELIMLDFAGNSIESVAENVFTPLRKLKTIVLKHNHLKQIPEKLFQNMPKLVNIDLSYNDIQVINLASFRNTPMKNLNLSGNNLTYMPVNFYGTLISFGGKLKKFLFTNNPWQCACLRDILQEVKEHNIEYNMTVYDGKLSVCVSDGDFICNRG
ncbi:unnamed protein product [Diatraea saccharalis]|uniref:Uncharacterized protein n=1 Tax=Diatraea saccharalis TaxID=40085 RepID=A0A9N9RDY0_9NEOP|nr:unnamed protein product [Diatraea saccharalis]